MCFNLVESIIELVGETYVEKNKKTFGKNQNTT